MWLDQSYFSALECRVLLLTRRLLERREFFSELLTLNYNLLSVAALVRRLTRLQQRHLGFLYLNSVAHEEVKIVSLVGIQSPIQTHEGQNTKSRK